MTAMQADRESPVRTAPPLTVSSDALRVERERAASLESQRDALTTLRADRGAIVARLKAVTQEIARGEAMVAVCEATS